MGINGPLPASRCPVRGDVLEPEKVFIRGGIRSETCNRDSGKEGVPEGYQIWVEIPTGWYNKGGCSKVDKVIKAQTKNRKDKLSSQTFHDLKKTHSNFREIFDIDLWASPLSNRITLKYIPSQTPWTRQTCSGVVADRQRPVSYYLTVR